MITSESLTIGSSALNEEESLETVVREWVEVLPTLVEDWEILLVDDGSTDRTGDIMEALRDELPNIRVIHHPYNLGFRGFANTIAKNARKSLMAGVSCDGEVDIRDLGPMLDKIEQGADVVIGARAELVNYTPYRKLVSGSYNALVSLLFGEDFEDIGSVKIFRTEILHEIDCISRSAFMNAERLVKARRLGYRIEVAETTHHPRLGGKARGASFSWVRDSVVDLARVAWQIHSGAWRPKR